MRSEKNLNPHSLRRTVTTGKEVVRQDSPTENNKPYVAVRLIRKRVVHTKLK